MLPPAAVVPGRRGPAVAAAVAAALGVWVVWRVFVTTRTGQLVEEEAFAGAELGQSRLWRVAEPVLDVVSVPFVGLVLVAAMVLAVLRRRALLALQVAVLVGGANLTTQVLKHVAFDRPDLDVGDRLANALPSGHTTVAASVSAALLLVVPRRLRGPAAVVGAAYTGATGISTLVGQWHRPSDVVAAVLVVTTWTAVACAMGVRGTPRSGSGARGLTGAAVTVLLAGAVAAAVGGAFALRRTLAHVRDDADGGGRADLLTAYGGGALGVLAVVCVCAAVWLLLVRVCEPRVEARDGRRPSPDDAVQV